jgi:hypothetical protein
MKTIARRLYRLEERFGFLPETEFDRRLRARIEAAQQRVAEARKRGELQPPETASHTEACRRRLMEAFGIRVKSEPTPDSTPAQRPRDYFRVDNPNPRYLVWVEEI